MYLSWQDSIDMLTKNVLKWKVFSIQQTAMVGITWQHSSAKTVLKLEAIKAEQVSQELEM